MIADPDMDEATRADMAQWTGCIAGALTRREFEAALARAGLVDVEITETHRVHQHAASAIIRAVAPRRSGRGMSGVATFRRPAPAPRCPAAFPDRRRRRT